MLALNFPAQRLLRIILWRGSQPVALPVEDVILAVGNEHHVDRTGQIPLQNIVPEALHRETVRGHALSYILGAKLRIRNRKQERHFALTLAERESIEHKGWCRFIRTDRLCVKKLT